MARKTYTAEQIIGMLREAEVRLAKGEKIGAICRGPVSRSRATTVGGVSMPKGWDQRREVLCGADVAGVVMVAT